LNHSRCASVREVPQSASQYQSEDSEKHYDTLTAAIDRSYRASGCTPNEKKLQSEWEAIGC
jgi:hypothetical protein